MSNNLQRRDFLKASATFAAFNILPSGAKAVSPSGKLRTAHIGVGGMGGADLRSISSHPKVEVAGLCDIDINRLNAAQKLHPHAQTFRDFREMLAAIGDSVDAVVVSTPDHTHFAPSMTAVSMGIHCYTEPHPVWQ